MIKIFSINEIVKASDNILKLSGNNNSFLDIKSPITKITKVVTKKNSENKVPIKIYNINKDEFIKEIYNLFNKKLKKNTIKLIIDLKQKLTNLDNKILILEFKKNKTKQLNQIYKHDITNLKKIEKNLQDKSDENQLIYNLLKEKNINTELESQKFLKDIEIYKIKIEDYEKTTTSLKLKNKDLEIIIKKLRSDKDHNIQNLNIINELEDKIQYHQDENLRIGNQLFQTNKSNDIIKRDIEILQDQRLELVEKVNLVNSVIDNSKIVTHAFQDASLGNKKSNEDSHVVKKNRADLNKEILNIFNNKNKRV
jgi:hypothetical protein|tara:strand:+ start:1581 stop:2510 length:930 start_codon:yes stop_codon:yes gene_type:complete